MAKFILKDSVYGRNYLESAMSLFDLALKAESFKVQDDMLGMGYNYLEKFKVLYEKEQE